MKRALAVILSALMLLSCCTVAFAAEKATINDKGEKVLKFNTDGKFKILQINDTQDTDKMNKRTEAFIRAAVAQVGREHAAGRAGTVHCEFHGNRLLFILL